MFGQENQTRTFVQTTSSGIPRLLVNTPFSNGSSTSRSAEPTCECAGWCYTATHAAHTLFRQGVVPLEICHNCNIARGVHPSVIQMTSTAPQLIAYGFRELRVPHRLQEKATPRVQ